MREKNADAISFFCLEPLPRLRSLSQRAPIHSCRFCLGGSREPCWHSLFTPERLKDCQFCRVYGHIILMQCHRYGRSKWWNFPLIARLAAMKGTNAMKALRSSMLRKLRGRSPVQPYASAGRMCHPDCPGLCHIALPPRSATVSPTFRTSSSRLRSGQCSRRV